MLRLCAIRTFFLDPRAALWIAAPYFYSCNNTGGNVSASSLSSLLSVTVSAITVANMADVLAVAGLVFFFIPSSHRLAQTLNAERNSRLPSLIFFFLLFIIIIFSPLQRREMLPVCSQPCFYDFQKREAGWCAPTSSRLSLRPYLTASLACAQAGGSHRNTHHVHPHKPRGEGTEPRRLHPATAVHRV